MIYISYLQCPVADTREMETMLDTVSITLEGGRRWRGVMIVSHCRQRTLYDTQITTEQIFGAV